jgi:hypothetical protein
MQRYDPLMSPDAEAWQALDEDERLELVLEYHREAGEELPEEQQSFLHATAHVIVENQVALGVSPVPDTLGRLMREGLGRHDAIHAIASVVMGEIYEGLRDNATDVGDKYLQRLRGLTARGWRKGKS